jgi:16S rRNA (cytidine1402-2'-O)-methyltransferase
MLYIVATPIGNLKDISQRAASLLSVADFIICERPGHSLKLLSALDIKHKPLVAYTEANKKSSIPKIILKLKSGKTACFITDAGTPGASDPGAELVNACYDRGISVVSVPGPSALTAAIPLTGERISKFLFVGFFPRKQKEFNQRLELAKTNDFWLIGFESPFRITKILKQIPEDFFVILVSEISKIHEKTIKGSPKRILDVLEADKNLAKGEFVVFVKSN